MRLRHSPRQPSSRGLRQGERCRDRSPPDIYGVSVRLGEDAPLALLPPPTEPRPVAFVREGDVAGEPPPNIYGVAFVRERTRLRSSSRRTSSHDHLQRGGCRRQPSPKYLRHGCRPGGGCASGPPPVEPRRVAILQEGDAAGDPPPTFAVLWLSGGRMRLQHSPCRPSSRGLCPGGRRRGRSPPLMFAARRSSGGWVRLWSSSRQTYTANFREGVAAGDPPPNIYGVAVVRGEDAPLILLPPSLVAWPSWGRDAPATLPQVFAVAVVRGEDAPPDLLPPNLVAWPSSGRNAPATLPQIGEDAPLDLLPPTLVVWPSSGRDAPVILSPNIRGGGRRGGGRASGISPAEPRPVASIRGRDAAIAHPPNILGGCRPRGGCASGTPLAEPRRLLFFGEGDAAIDPPLDIRGTAVVRGGWCAIGPPPAESRRVAFFREGERMIPWHSSPQYLRRGGRRGGDAPPPLPPSTLVPWPPSGRETPAILPHLIAAWRSSGRRMLLQYLSRRISSRGHLQGRRRHQRSPPHNIRGVAVVLVEGAPPVLLPPAPRRVAIFREGNPAGDPPPIFAAWRSSAGRVRLRCISCGTSSRCLFRGGGRRLRSSPKYLPRGGRSEPPNLVVWPSSMRGMLPVILLPTFASLRSAGGGDASPELPPPTLVPWPSSGRETSRSILSPISAAWRSAGKRTRLPHSPRPPSSRGLSPRGSCRRRSSPQCSRRGGRPEEGCTSGTPPADPRRMAFVWEGDAAFDTPPKVRGAAVIRGEDAPPVLLPPNLIACPSFREGDVADDPPSNIYGVAVDRGENAPPVLLPLTLVPLSPSGRETPRLIPPQHSQCGGRRGGWCASGTPPADPRLVAFVGKKEAVIYPPHNTAARRSSRRRVRLRPSPRRPPSRVVRR